MLLNYLFENFYEEAAFIHHAGLDFDSLRSLLEQRVLPKPSYVLNNTASSKTFLGQHEEMGTYRFYLKRYTDWVVKVERFDLHNEKKPWTTLKLNTRTLGTCFSMEKMAVKFCGSCPTFRTISITGISTKHGPIS
ncbi:MAG: hypothetical protein ABJN26_08200 [Stappiaceae bacterium]